MPSPAQQLSGTREARVPSPAISGPPPGPLARRARPGAGSSAPPTPSAISPTKKPPPQADLQRTGDWQAAAAPLERASLDELRTIWQATFGTTASSNATYVRRRLITHALEGGALRLGDKPSASATPVSGGRMPTAPRRPPAAIMPAESMSSGKAADPRRPPPGTVLQRQVGAEVHEVVVYAETFEYRGTHFKSLSAIAFAISGTHWNGWTYWGLATRKNSKPLGSAEPSNDAHPDPAAAADRG